MSARKKTGFSLHRSQTLILQLLQLLTSSLELFKAFVYRVHHKRQRLEPSLTRNELVASARRPPKEMLVRVVAMLTQLIDRFDTDDTRNRGS